MAARRSGLQPNRPAISSNVSTYVPSGYYGGFGQESQRRRSHRLDQVSDPISGEAFGIDCGAVIERDAQRRPVRSGHVWLGGFVERLTCLVDGLGERFGSGPISVADIGWPGLGGVGLSGRKTFRTPAQPFGKLFQRFDLHEVNCTTAEGSQAVPGWEQRCRKQHIANSLLSRSGRWPTLWLRLFPDTGLRVRRHWTGLVFRRG